MTQLKTTSVVLLLLLLAGMAIVPYVSAEEGNEERGDTEVLEKLIDTNDIIDKNTITTDTAHKHATVMMAESLVNGRVNDDWHGAIINSEPLVINDINGKALFYQFSVEKDSKPIGLIKISANKILGISLQEIGDPSTFDPQQITLKAISIATKDYPEFTVSSSEIVCYNYPSIGVKIYLVNSNTREHKTVIYDAYDYSDVAFKKPTKEGESGAWSYLNEIPVSAYNERRDKWLNSDAYVNTVVETASGKGIDINRPRTIEQDQIIQNAITAAQKGVFEVGEIPGSFPTAYQGYTQWCQAGTALVITKFYKPDCLRTINDIRLKMNIPNEQSGADYTDEINYYKASYAGGAANGGLDKFYSWWSMTQPPLTYTKVKQEISAGRPMKIGQNGHARACIGFSKNPDGDKYFKFSDTGDARIKWLPSPTLYSDATGYESYAVIQ
ncbi:MAG: hypothetical protein CVV32_07495 [Methanomicrobiales archaeon HGW-Methanomicrobiales-3]|jgi:hypothetical protein|nr:MAG: hypothetical protein CVV32_07495 [Methanomicrobiales archaeon HGW-Methanomicrobiales-3]